MLCDFHLHTSFSGDSDTPPEDQILKAAALNMPRICVTDHHDMDVVSDCDFTLDLPKYFPAMEALREQYRDQIRIEIGIGTGAAEPLSPRSFTRPPSHIPLTLSSAPAILLTGRSA